MDSELIESYNFDTLHAYDPHNNKTIGNIAPNKCNAVGSTIFWDLNFEKCGAYDLFLNTRPIGTTSIEFGYILPGEEIIISGSILLPASKDIKKYKLGTLNIPSNNTVCTGIESSAPKVNLSATGVTHPIFIRIIKSSGRVLLVKSISLIGPGKVSIIELTNAATMRNIHHAAAAYCRAFFKTKAPQFIYREFIATKWHPNTFTTIAFNGGYVGIVVGKFTGMSIWNSPNGDANMIIETGPGVTTKTYDHEGSGTQFSLQYPVKEGVKYGYMIRIEHKQKGTEFPNGATDFSSWFINTEQTDKQVKWHFIGKVRRFCLTQFGSGDNKTTFSSIGGFLENPSTSNGHLYTRKVAIGNSWASIDGINWDASFIETYTTKNWNTYCGATGGPYEKIEGFIEYAIGGRIKCQNNGNYTLTRTNPKLPDLLKSFTLNTYSPDVGLKLNVTPSLKLSYTPDGCVNDTYEVAPGCKRILDPTVCGIEADEGDRVDD